MILIGTDFSPGSQRAATIGLLVAKKTDSQVTLLHAFKVHSRSGMFLSMDRYIRNAAEEDMAGFVTSLDPDLQPWIAETRVVRGFPEEVIMQWDEAEDIGLVVVGTQGASAVREIFMGRTANILLNKLKSPILAVPAEADAVPPGQLVFAWDGLPLARDAADRLLDWAKVLDIPLEVIHVETVHSKPCDPYVIDYFGSRKVPLRIIPGEGDVKDEIDDDLIGRPDAWLCLIKRERGFFEPFFHDSMVKRELFSTTRPILIL